MLNYMLPAAVTDTSQFHATLRNTINRPGLLTLAHAADVDVGARKKPNGRLREALPTFATKADSLLLTIQVSHVTPTQGSFSLWKLPSHPNNPILRVMKLYFVVAADCSALATNLHRLLCSGQCATWHSRLQ